MDVGAGAGGGDDARAARGRRLENRGQVRGPKPETLHVNMQRFQGELVFTAQRLCVSVNSRLESNKEEAEQCVVDR